jgi:WD40 repeat protein
MSQIMAPHPRGGAPSAVRRVYGARPFHTDGDLLALAFAADGALWSVEEPGALRRWDVAARQQTGAHFLDEPATLWAFGPGARLVGAASDELSVWDVQTGGLLGNWNQPSWVTALAFPDAGGLIATGHDDGLVRLWDRGRLEVVRELRGHEAAVSALAFAPGGRRLASAGEDRVVRVWDVDAGAEAARLDGHTDRIPALAWHPDGKHLYSAGWDATARVWYVPTGEPLFLFNGHDGQVVALALGPDGGLLACADSSNAVRIWDTASRRAVAVLRRQAAEVRCLAFSPDGRRLASGGAERLVHLWDARRGPDAEDLADPLVSRTCLAVSPDGGRLASLGAGTALRVWEAAGGAPGVELEGAGALRAFAASPDGRWYAASLAGPDGPDDWGAKTTPSADAPRRTAGLWDARAGRRLAVLDGQRAPVTALAFSPDSSLLASGGFLGGDVWLWRVPSGEPALVIPDAAPGCAVECLAFAPAGALLAVGGVDCPEAEGVGGEVALWDLGGRRKALALRGGARALAFHPGGARLAVASPTQAVRVYDLRSGKPVAELIGHLDAVTCVAYSPDGRLVATGGDDRAVRLWDAETGLPRGSAELGTQVKALAFTPDGRSLFTGNGNTSCYQLDVAELLAAGAGRA